MDTQWARIIRQSSRPLEPLPTDAAASLPPLGPIRAVLWDIYGTLLVSGSGDVGAADEQLRCEAACAALEAVGLAWPGDVAAPARAYREAIDAAHAVRRAAGIAYPEVDIVEVWRSAVKRLAGSGAWRSANALGDEAPWERGDFDWERLALEYEVRANPTWPMPNLGTCLEKLCRQRMILGIISNAQFFTPHLFPCLTGKSLDDFGFDPNLRYYSYEYGCAKPGRELYELARTALEQRGIAARETLYVGNDVRNDIWPATAAGFQAVLFAGDRRSLRWRRDDLASGRYPSPAAIVTDLGQIEALLATA